MPGLTQFVGTITGTTLVVTSLTGSAPISTGQHITGIGITDGTFIVDQILPGPGEAYGGIGQYTVNISQTVATTTITCDIVVENAFLTQEINNTVPGALHLSLDIDIFAVFPDNIKYVGKTYTIASLTTDPHTLTLDGSYFMLPNQPIQMGSGVTTLDGSGTSTILTPNIQTGFNIILTAQSTSVGAMYVKQIINGTSFTIASTAGASDSGVTVYYQISYVPNSTATVATFGGINSFLTFVVDAFFSARVLEVSNILFL